MKLPILALTAALLVISMPAFSQQQCQLDIQAIDAALASGVLPDGSCIPEWKEQEVTDLLDHAAALCDAGQENEASYPLTVAKMLLEVE